ncbi:MAG: adenosine deaminase [Gammaproteobacteria bacterium 39-13]|nr:DNA-3-methyladenine glycosylase 2 [Gammaproteobacteria bacterium]OJV93135.1 MAG: adenosine deaminase [Gammaproteobacteria bacterium 39-13]
MKAKDPAYYNACISRDPRFDGVFFVGVITTGIYCRPVCPAKKPKATNCRFFNSAEAAEKASFRPCLRCRPELAPGNAPIDNVQRIAHLILHRIDEAMIGNKEVNLEDIAIHFNLSSRQIRRILQKELGVSPIELIQTRRLLLAKQLLTETSFSVTQIAYTSGFSSLRRFNDAFSRRYGMAPSRLRKQATQNEIIKPSTTAVLQLGYRPPYDWQGVLQFLSTRLLKGTEWITPECYARTVRLGEHSGWFRVQNAPEKNVLLLEFTHSLMPVLPALLGRIRNLFDLDARPDIIAQQLMQDKLLKKVVAQNPGLRVPGTFDGFEMAVRAILGQQITVKAATTLASRFIAAFGEEVETPFDELTLFAPSPDRIAKATVDEIAKLGIISSRAKSIIALAKICMSNALSLEIGADPEAVIKQLKELPGIGQWTAHYIAMRALRWPDAFLKDDIAIRNKFGGITAKQLDELSQAWRPWRSYAVLHIWHSPTLNLCS